MKKSRDLIQKELVKMLFFYAASKDWDENKLMDAFEYLGLPDECVERVLDEEMKFISNF